MLAVDSANPEQLIASMKRRRTLTVALALAGIAAGLGVLFTATGAMYAKDPMRELQTERAALQSAPAEP